MKHTRRALCWCLFVILFVVALWIRVHLRGGLWYVPRE